MNRKRIILLLLAVILIHPTVIAEKEKKFEFDWKATARAPFDVPFEVYLDGTSMLHIYFMLTDVCMLTIETLDGQIMYTTTLSAMSGQDVFIDLEQLPSGTYLLSLENERLEATGYLIL